MALSKKKQLFVNEYLKSFNATKAAQAAGYSGNNNVMAQRGYELVRNSDIAELIRDRLQESAMSANEVLMRLAEQARAQYSCYLGSDGHVDLEGLLADGKGHLIKGIKETKYGRQIEINLEVDLNTLSNEQISRLANGESLTDVLGG
jgi:hypothetical protein